MTSKVSTAHFSNSIKHLSFKYTVLCCTWLVFLPISDLLALWNSDFLQHLLLWFTVFTLATSNSCSGWCLLESKAKCCALLEAECKKEFRGYQFHHSYINGKFIFVQRSSQRIWWYKSGRCLVRFEEVLGNLSSLCVFLGLCRTCYFLISKCCYALSQKQCV